MFGAVKKASYCTFIYSFISVIKFNLKSRKLFKFCRSKFGVAIDLLFIFKRPVYRMAIALKRVQQGGRKREVILLILIPYCGRGKLQILRTPNYVEVLGKVIKLTTSVLT